MRKYNFNEAFFDKWSEPMAYILGFIIADGNISKTQYSLRLAIHEKDIEVLHYINEQFGASYPIRYQRGIYPYISWNSKKLIGALSSLGVLPNKRYTWCGTTYKVPDEYISSLIRGFFDGDGWVSHKEGRYCKMLISGFANKSKRFLEQIKHKVPTTGGHLRQRPTWHELSFANKDSIILRDFMYQNDGFSLKRKREKFHSIQCIST